MSPGPVTDAARLALSAATAEGAVMRTEDVVRWLGERRRGNRFRVERIPLDRMDRWYADDGTGDIRHRSGGFFTVEGIRARTGHGPVRVWEQPIICQREVGILGILVKEFDGVLHCLMQAKMEPGNRPLLQLSPTVQATRSNYTRVHRGARVKYIDYFTGSERVRVLADSQQSEHGSWFHRKSNRNTIVETDGDVPRDDDYCWLTLGQIAALLHHDNVINMDSRTVLSCVPLPDAGEKALHPDTEIDRWLKAERVRRKVHVEPLPLSAIDGWRRGTHTIDHESGRYFRVVGVSVQAGNREVTGWSQPLFEPRGLGVTAFLTRRIGGVRHVLAQARAEAGLHDSVELAPTVQCTPENYAHLAPGDRPLFLDQVLAAGRADILYEAVHSEEGGRFLGADSRCLLVEAGDRDPGDEAPSGYRWLTAGQLSRLVRRGHHVNVQARTLLACLNATAAAGR
ncbi:MULTISPECIES: NDP-hexose 2,3-dehydratase family protein [Streptomyces]|uniref:NDP-hexose 2,3-dehydratase family protein n=1 Tax=Streptomyces TaxID=1883 RepID=UPI000C274B83|nr:NDP-hexose 2,3-dehydratase family protein [Streptomyces sp. CB02613]PJN30417.1 NDP-hexose 2,3-dehydratase [Streptomyces sp. CB02613]